MSFHETCDSSSHDDCTSNSEKHLQWVSFDSLPGNEQYLYHFSRSRTSRLHVRAQLRISITKLVWWLSLIHQHSKISLSCEYVYSDFFFKTLRRLPIRIISILSHRLAISKKRVYRMSGKSFLTFYFTPVYLHRQATYYEENRVFWWHFLGSINCR